MDFEFLQALEEDWEPVSRPARYAWLAFYGLFYLYAVSRGGNQLFIDLVFLPIHEGGHLLFRWVVSAGECRGILTEHIAAEQS
jgi:hypothetical protein